MTLPDHEAESVLNAKDAAIDKGTALVEKYTLHSFEEIASLGPCTVAFYGGSFDPPHYGHSAVIEGALRKYVKYVIVSVHSWNPEKKETITDLRFRLMMVAAGVNAMFYHDRIFLADPHFLNGIQNASFAQLVQSLASRDVKVSVLIGADAVRDNYPVFMRGMDHVLASRNGGYGQASTILSGSIHRITAEDKDAAFHRVRTFDLILVADKIMSALSGRWADRHRQKEYEVTLQWLSSGDDRDAALHRVRTFDQIMFSLSEHWASRHEQKKYKEYLEWLCSGIGGLGIRGLGYDITPEKLSHMIEARSSNE